MDCSLPYAKACQCVAPASLAIYAQDKGKCNVQGTLKGAQYKQVSMYHQWRWESVGPAGLFPTTHICSIHLIWPSSDEGLGDGKLVLPTPEHVRCWLIDDSHSRAEKNSNECECDVGQSGHIRKT